MPATPPPNVANLPHDVADFVLSVTLAPNVDDDSAARLGGPLNELAAEWLVKHRSELVDFLRAALLDGDAESFVRNFDAAVDVVIGPRALIDETRARLEARGEL